MKRLSLVPAILLLTFGSAGAGQSLKEIMTPPADSLEKENVRIWIPIERRSKCYLTIDIMNQKSQVIRHLVDLMAGPGYHNFYWDKKDDSGAFVDSGTYTYEANNCGKKSYGEVRAVYGKTRLKIISDLGESFHESFSDSSHLRIEWYSKSNIFLMAVVDTILNEGKHIIDITKSRKLRAPREEYFQVIRIDGAVAERKSSRSKGAK
jgi:hypothetical protein